MSSTDEEDVGNLVVIVIDVNPVWWGKRSHHKQQKDVLAISQCMDSVMVFVNSHLMMDRRNKVALIASHTNESRFLYPKKTSDLLDDVDDQREQDEMNSDGKYEVFASINDAVMEELKNLVDEIGEKIKSRILVLKAADDSASQYMNFMNVTFTAQKQNIPIDACILDKDSSLLQQACDITGGKYLKVLTTTGLLQYLLWVYLPSPSLRESLVLPPAIHVDYRAACFCHRTLIDVGYVCSVCLSIFCTYSPICSTCHTAFKIKGAPSKMKRKKKSSAVTSIT
ncbi:general transcription factor IIH subunit 3-like isoform X2 [Lytechinus pictus]|uniref:general transcription factor IIH subunit 3-like isoform X2 n=1 Tax=Lytechinus pictus TaxID=7653 RepID=UPI0030B9E8B4